MKEEKKETKKLNIYEKITNIKSEFLKSNVKKSGKNKFANYTYYELADITPVLIELCKKYGIFTKFSYTKDQATLEIVNIEKPDEREIYTSPMEELELKGCNKIQALGGTETYQRRYLYMSAFDIIENDLFDATSGTKQNESKPKYASKNTDKEDLISAIDNLEIQTSTDHEEMLKFYKVDSNTDMSIEQLQDAKHRLEMKLKKQRIENLEIGE
jgi:hypothetical protein